MHLDAVQVYRLYAQWVVVRRESGGGPGQEGCCKGGMVADVAETPQPCGRRCMCMVSVVAGVLLPVTFELAMAATCAAASRISSGVVRSTVLPNLNDPVCSWLPVVLLVTLCAQSQPPDSLFVDQSIKLFCKAGGQPPGGVVEGRQGGTAHHTDGTICVMGSYVWCCRCQPAG